MGLSTHVLDTMHGRPAAGMQVALYAVVADQHGHNDRPEGRHRNNDTNNPTNNPTNASGASHLLKSFTLNADGRCPEGLLLDKTSLQRGNYRLVFEVATYFRNQGVVLPDPPFLDRVTLDFGIADPTSHYHVPLLATPWSYSTYRGS